MKDFLNYKIEDYLSDVSFRIWVKNGGFADPQADWTRRLQLNPSQLVIATSAREILLATASSEEGFAPDFEEQVIENTLKNIRQRTGEKSAPSRNWLLPLSAAASITVLLISGWYIFFKQPQLRGVSSAAHSLPAVVMLEKRNEGNKIMPVALPDGSTVLLQPGSKISYPKTFNTKTREVRLSGQAFFEVIKNKNLPFLVHSRELTTKVLGTSFTVRAFDNQPDLAVVVKTGKVSVSANTGKNGMKASIDLIPNQQAIFNRSALSLIRMDVKPATMSVMVPATETTYSFNDAHVTEIFRTLSKRYDVTIEANEALLSDCFLTTTFADEPLFEKLKIICGAIGPSTSYRVEGARIIINTKGCNL
ncbi:hypothetical protein DYBT9275_00795 [Dyadobacter sp. CECT 9275]|uniref:FecR family protein n=1 Tax=Dyadobacter helix TaxID=2822344 RepID=A0A916J7S6_9BACT|nr:FecR family protein [Dyadobacter sp. CECT 9275]CAG4991630.1 hypothetical protein DYBT9275_00795 [Dyadobacter sp. CECT 9275]